MIHIRIDDSLINSKRKFACGIGPTLPEGDTYYFAGEAGSYKADCKGCNPGGPGELGTPISKLTQAEFERIGRSWGYP